MTEITTDDADNGESRNVPGGRVIRFIRIIYKFLASVKLALALLVMILVCCVAGVTVYRGERAWTLIFNTLWFNGILVLLVVNVAFCFFGRMWGRKVTLISFGMILFHLSFVAMLGGIIYNSLFYFRGVIRLSEGETLPNGDIQSYDYAEHGRFFSFSKLKGETTLIKMYKGYKVDGVDKQVAYEVAVGDRRSKNQGIIYVTQRLDHNGFSYFREKEGYTLLIVLFDKSGKELYGAYVPLQSLIQKDNSYLYTTGTKVSPGSFPYPQEPLKPLYAFQVAYIPKQLKERVGEAVFQVWPLNQADGMPGRKTIAECKVPIGKRFKVGDRYISVAEVRYWVAMFVRYEPGKPIALTSLWVCLAGMILTFFARARKNRI